MKLALFGAGKIGTEAAGYYLWSGYEIGLFIDNCKDKWGSSIYGAPVVSLEEYKKNMEQYELVLTANIHNMTAIKEQLKKENIDEYQVFDIKVLHDYYLKRIRLLSYSMECDLEDVILYHLLRDEESIFYIDVRSNDPVFCSVTKLLYDMKNASGINIEPQQNLIDITNRERQRDINLCMGVGKEDGRMELFVQGGLTTVVKEHIREEYHRESVEIPVTTLKRICDEYVKDRAIQILKIDVEGFEKEVLEGADFARYRPWIVLVEAVAPEDWAPCWEQWEYILLENGYHFMHMYGANRYYVSNEMKKLDQRFIPIEKIKASYCISHMGVTGDIK